MNFSLAIQGPLVGVMASEKTIGSGTTEVSRFCTIYQVGPIECGLKSLCD